MSQNQTILIAGATGNIGGGAAIALAKRGACVVLLGRKHETLAARADAIRVALADAQIQAQEADKEGGKRLWDALVQKTGLTSV
jgi:short-subunit dehydrogenase